MGCQEWSRGWEYPRAYLLERLRVKENPSKLNHLGRVFRHVNAMLVARGSYVDDDVAVDVELGRLLGRHFALRAPCGLHSASRYACRVRREGRGGSTPRLDSGGDLADGR